MIAELNEVAVHYGEHECLGSCQPCWESYVEYAIAPGGAFEGATNIPDDFYNLPPEALDAFDAVVFECQTCNWWCEISEVASDENGENICLDCAPDEDE